MSVTFLLVITLNVLAVYRECVSVQRRFGAVRRCDVCRRIGRHNAGHGGHNEYRSRRLRRSRRYVLNCISLGRNDTGPSPAAVLHVFVVSAQETLRCQEESRTANKVIAQAFKLPSVILYNFLTP